MSMIAGPMMKEWNISYKEISMLQSSMFGGELLGGLFWGTLSDKLGRRLTFTGTAALATVFGILASYSFSFNMFLVCRFGLGLAIGGSLSVDFIYFVEFVPASTRGIRTTFIIFLGICACTDPVCLCP